MVTILKLNRSEHERSELEKRIFALGLITTFGGASNSLK